MSGVHKFRPQTCAPAGVLRAHLVDSPVHGGAPESPPDRGLVASGRRDYTSLTDPTDASGASAGPGVTRGGPGGIVARRGGRCRRRVAQHRATGRRTSVGARAPRTPAPRGPRTVRLGPPAVRGGPTRAGRARTRPDRARSGHGRGVVGRSSAVSPGRACGRGGSAHRGDRCGRGAARQGEPGDPVRLLDAVHLPVRGADHLVGVRAGRAHARSRCSRRRARDPAAWRPAPGARPRPARRATVSRARSSPGHRMTNSSPPSRATTSCRPVTRRSRSATSTSTRSPTWCPWVSLASLKPSRSANSSPQPDDPGPVERLARAPRRGRHGCAGR